jgi:hypothetical protein
MIDQYNEAAQKDEIRKMDESQRVNYNAALNRFDSNEQVKQFKNVVSSFDNMVSSLEQSKSKNG